MCAFLCCATLYRSAERRVHLSNYVFIESRDPFDSPDTNVVSEKAVALRKKGHTVTVFLVRKESLALERRPQNHRYPPSLNPASPYSPMTSHCRSVASPWMSAPRASRLARWSVCSTSSFRKIPRPFGTRVPGEWGNGPCSILNFHPIRMEIEN